MQISFIFNVFSALNPHLIQPQNRNLYRRRAKNNVIAPSFARAPKLILFISIPTAWVVSVSLTKAPRLYTLNKCCFVSVLIWKSPRLFSVNKYLFVSVLIRKSPRLFTVNKFWFVSDLIWKSP